MSTNQTAWISHPVYDQSGRRDGAVYYALDEAWAARASDMGLDVLLFDPFDCAADQPWNMTLRGEETNQAAIDKVLACSPKPTALLVGPNRDYWRNKSLFFVGSDPDIDSGRLLQALGAGDPAGGLRTLLDWLATLAGLREHAPSSSDSIAQDQTAFQSQAAALVLDMLNKLDTRLCPSAE